MRYGALSTSAVTVALAAVSFAIPAAAGPRRCGDITDHVSVEIPGENDAASHKLRIDKLLDASQHIPEPGFLALLGVGLVGVALAHLFKRR